MSSALAKIILFLLILGFLGFGIYWLWQRQPNVKDLNLPKIEKLKADDPKQQFEIEPKDSTILTSKTVKFKGKATEGFLAIYSNNFQHILKIDTDGKFEKDIDLSVGLNLIEIVSIPKNLEGENKTSLTYYLIDQSAKQKVEDVGKAVFAGSLKSILESAITVTTAGGEKNVKTSKSTVIELPQGEKPDATRSALGGLRVGDYVIALGNLSDTTLDAKKIQIIRSQKPTLNVQLGNFTVLAAVKQNIFSARIEKESKIEEFTIEKNTQVLKDGQSTKTDDVTKDKKVLIIYEAKEGSKLAKLVYLLP